MKLTSLLDFDDIVIQCHDNPDADAIASGFAVHRYLTENKKSVRLVYSGEQKIQKPNLKIMIEELQIPIEHITKLDMPNLLITVDCQYGEGNVTRFEAEQVAVIDHHQLCIAEDDFTEICSHYGSCATIIYDMLIEAEFIIDQDLSTALYYGLFMDTNGFSEIKHPIDMDMMEDLYVKEHLINRLKNANFSLHEVEIAGKALRDHVYNKNNGSVVLKTEPCDPNILGFISDLMLQIDEIDVCIVFNEEQYGYKLSVRSCKRSATANDIVQYITSGIGTGGGHKNKAGGTIVKHKFKSKFPNMTIQDYFAKSLADYYESYDIIDIADNQNIDESGMRVYRMLPIEVGYVKTSQFAREGTVISVRTLEGDVNVVAGEDIYIMIGTEGEVYPIKKEAFLHDYDILNQKYNIVSEYQPSVRNRITMEIYELGDYAQSCVARGTTTIFARQIERTTKVFTNWCYDDYMLGKKGDYLAVKNEDPTDVYIVDEDIFHKDYEQV